VIGSESSDDAIGGYDVHDVQPKNGGDCMSAGGGVVLEAAGNVRVCRLKMCKSWNAEVRGTGLRVTSEDRQTGGRLRFNLARNWTVKAGVESISAGMEGKGLLGTGTHGAP
jgi:hypothetical protein